MPNAGAIAIGHFGAGKVEVVDGDIAIGDQDPLPFGIRPVEVILTLPPTPSSVMFLVIWAYWLE